MSRLKCDINVVNPFKTVCWEIWKLVQSQTSDMPLNIGGSITGVGVKNLPSKNEILIPATPEEGNPL